MQEQIDELTTAVALCLAQQAQWGIVLNDLLQKSSELSNAVEALSATQANVAKALKLFTLRQGELIQQVNALTKAANGDNEADWWQNGPEDSQ